MQPLPPNSPTTKDWSHPLLIESHRPQPRNREEDPKISELQYANKLACTPVPRVVKRTKAFNWMVRMRHPFKPQARSSSAKTEDWNAFPKTYSALWLRRRAARIKKLPTCWLKKWEATSRWKTSRMVMRMMNCPTTVLSHQSKGLKMPPLRCLLKRMLNVESTTRWMSSRLLKY
jgi:hypothetical protein